MYIRLGAADAAVPVLAQSVTVLEKQAPPTMPRSTRRARSWRRRCCRPVTTRRGFASSPTRRARACANSTVDCAKARAYAADDLEPACRRWPATMQTALAEMRRSARDMRARVRSESCGDGASSSCAWPFSRAIPAQLVEAGACDGTRSGHRRASAVARGGSRGVRAIDGGHRSRSRPIRGRPRDRLRALISQPTRSARDAPMQYRLLATVYVELG